MVDQGVERAGVLNDAADVAQAFLRQVGILVAGEERFAAPSTMTGVRACPIPSGYSKDRLKHEGRRFATRLRDIENATLKDLGGVPRWSAYALASFVLLSLPCARRP